MSADPQTVPAPKSGVEGGAGAISHSAWLGDGLMLLTGSFEVGEGAMLAIVLDRRRGSPAAWIDLGAAGADPVKLVLARHKPAAPVGSLVVRDGRRRYTVGPPDLGQTLTDVGTLAREGLANLGQEAGQQAIRFLLTETCGDLDRVLGENLRVVRDAVREPLPVSVTDPSQHTAVHVECFFVLADDGFFAEGWLLAKGPPPESLTVVSPEGSRAELLPLASRYPRPDVGETFGLRRGEHEGAVGFTSYFELDAPTRLRDGWLIELRAATGGVESPVTSPNGGLREAREAILRVAAREPLSRDELKQNHVRPALTRIQERLVATARIDRVEQYGAPPANPRVSIVVPLYRRLDFLEQQLAQFVHDPELRSADLLYVLDSPEQAALLDVIATQLSRLYELPFRVAVLNQNSGFSAVNNLGASLARGSLLLLLNSDILPERPGWLARLGAFHEATPGLGALAPKLLYEDDSLQHAGLYFDRPPGAPVWTNEHFYKGLHRTFPAANVARPVPAVTGACLMISAGLFEKVGGFRGIYVQGDYEDSDLCLRLAELGYESWYYPEVELYHLEGQSYEPEERALASPYNAWLHTALWGSRLEAISTGLRMTARRRPRR